MQPFSHGRAGYLGGTSKLEIKSSDFFHWMKKASKRQKKEGKSCRLIIALLKISSSR